MDTAAVAAEGEEESVGQQEKVSFMGMFRYADGTDLLLMLVGTVAALANGLSQPLMTIVFGATINAFGDATSGDVLQRVNKDQLSCHKSSASALWHPSSAAQYATPLAPRLQFSSSWPMTESDLPACIILVEDAVVVVVADDRIRPAGVQGYTKKRKKWVQKLNMIWFKADWILAQSPHLDRLLKDGPGSRNMAPSEARS